MTTSSGSGIFDRAVREAEQWLDGIMAEMGWQDPERAYRTLWAVLQTLRDDLAPEDAEYLGSRLPLLVRGAYFEGWSAAGKPVRYRHKADFLRAVQQRMPDVSGSELERAVTGVFHVLSEQVPGGEMEEIRGVLPAEIRELWVLDAM